MRLASLRRSLPPSCRLVLWPTLIAVCGTATARAQGSASVQAECAERSVQRQVERAASILADWANLSRYRDANASLPALAGALPRVVFMGDSITDGWDDEINGGFFPGRPWVNRGISGQTTAQMLVRFRPDVVALRPRAVVILAGTNDLSGNTGPTTLEGIEGNLASMAELSRAHDIRVVFASVLPVSDYDRDRDGNLLLRTRCRPPDQIVALNQWIRRYAADNRHTYLDYHGATVDAKGFLKDELSEDGLHPNAKGYAVMAPLAEKAVAAALAAKR